MEPTQACEDHIGEGVLASAEKYQAGSEIIEALKEYGASE